MNEVLRLKKLEEKKEIDKQVSQGILIYGSPDIKKHKETDVSAQNELSDVVARAISRIDGTERHTNIGQSNNRSSKDYS